MSGYIWLRYICRQVSVPIPRTSHPCSKQTDVLIEKNIRVICTSSRASHHATSPIPPLITIKSNISCNALTQSRTKYGYATNTVAIEKSELLPFSLVFPTWMVLLDSFVSFHFIHSPLVLFQLCFWFVFAFFVFTEFFHFWEGVMDDDSYILIVVERAKNPQLQGEKIK